MTTTSPSVQAGRIKAKLADLDTFAQKVWKKAPSYRLSPPLDDAAIAEVEARLRVRLPEAYRAFVSEVGVAGVGPEHGLDGLDATEMPEQMPNVTATVTTVTGETFSAGTGPRPELAGRPDASRPFPLTSFWDPVDDDANPVTPPVAPGAHLYDGAINLGEIGCGYFHFLVVTGPQAGTVWVDYSAGDGSIAPLAPFLDWYEEWLDGCLASLLSRSVRKALDKGKASKQDDYIRRWIGSFETVAAGGGAGKRIDLAMAYVYLGRTEDADVLAAALDQDTSLTDDDRQGLALLEQYLNAEASTAAQASPPDAEVALGSRSWQVRLLLATNPQCPAAALAHLAADPRHEVRLAAARHPSCPSAALAGLAAARLADAGDQQAAFELDMVARHPATPPDVLAELASLDGPGLASAVPRGLAANPSCPAELLEQLARSPHPWVRAAVAGRLALPSLAADPHFAVRRAVASRPDAPLETLSVDPVEPVRVAVAANPAASAQVLVRLTGERSSSIAYAVAGNSAAPAEALAVLADHPSTPIRDDGTRPEPTELVEHLSLADAVTQRSFGNDAYPHALLGEAIAHPDTMVGYAAARSPWLDGPLLEQLAEHPYSYARARVAEHPAASPELVARMVSGDPSPMVQRQASPMASLGAADLHRLAVDDDEERRWAAADNPAAGEALLRRLADDPYNWVRRAVMTNPNTPLEVALRIGEEPDSYIRRHLPLRPDLTPDVLARLASDDDPAVARAARWQQHRRRLVTSAVGP